MPVKKVQIGIRVSPRFKDKLEKIAEHHKRTLSDFIRVEMERIVENEERDGILKKNEVNNNAKI